jgi:hypothetical protein
MSDDAIDRMVERMAREEEDDINRKQGEFILNITAARSQHADPLTDALRRAYQAKAEADEQ